MLRSREKVLDYKKKKRERRRNEFRFFFFLSFFSLVAFREREGWTKITS